MKTLATLFCLCFVLASAHCADPAPPSSDEAKSRVKKLLADIVVIDGCQKIDSINSQVVVKTAAIAKIVDGGVSNLDVLIAAMRDESISFDAFVRCYSASEQILQKVDPKLCVYWQGGSETKYAGQETRIFPRGQKVDVKSFRQDVTKDVEAKRLIAIKEMKK